MAEGPRPRPSEPYFAYDDASVQDIKASARAARFTGDTSQSPLLTYLSIKSRVEAFALKVVGKAVLGKRAQEGMDAVGTIHFAHWVALENNHVGFFTVFDGGMERYIQDFADEMSAVYDTIFPHVSGGPPTPVAKNAQAFYQWAVENNHPPIGFYSAYPGLSVQDIKALLADRKSQPVGAR